MKTQTFYLVGAGEIAKEHAKALYLLSDRIKVELYVTDINQQTLEKFCKQFVDAVPFSSLDAMLENRANKDDVVIVCTPPVAHYPVVMAALHSGRHVLCEKPLAMNSAQANEMLSAAKQEGRHLSCCSSRSLGLETTQEVKKIIASGGIGEPYHFRFINRQARGRSGVEYQPNSRWFLNSSVSGGGVLMDWGPYDFAVLSDILNPEKVHILSATVAKPATWLDIPVETVNDVEQHVIALMRFEDRDGKSILVNYERSACTHGEPLSVVEIEGVRGAVSWDWFCFDGNGQVSVSSDDQGKPVKNITNFQCRYHYNHRPILLFLDTLNFGTPPLEMNEQAVFDFNILQAIYECARTNYPQIVTKEVL